MNLKDIRTHLKLSQKEVAAHLGITQQAYANYERGERNPDPKTLSNIADFFDVSVDYLLGRTENLIPKESAEIRIPPILNGAQVAFHGGAGEGLSDDDIDMLVDLANRMRKKNQKQGDSNDKA